MPPVAGRYHLVKRCLLARLFRRYHIQIFIPVTKHDFLYFLSEAHKFYGGWPDATRFTQTFASIPPKDRHAGINKPARLYLGFSNAA